ncbi:hypothetical protein [Sinisalibacter aestuarii]|uniref:Transcriptional regulator n=1 Tax=Sinisalibacter aestuarii TaxID=2949426 RepID=A0ABQ5LQ87_9RHOB|nr:hypothetical protein [Sinisalibacter aestuarii]GKY86436.1 hypothetical protein STA1M1_03050 [Sinisalibacter aestuarii]
MSFYEMIAAVFGGSLFGSFLGPLLLENIREKRHRNRVVKPAERLLLSAFESTDAPLLRLKDLAVRIGRSEQETREILLGIGAAGAIMTDGNEGWYLLSNPIPYVTKNIDRSDK